MFEANLDALGRRQPALRSLLEPLKQRGAEAVRAEVHGGVVHLVYHGNVPVALGVAENPPLGAQQWVDSLEWSQFQNGILTCIGMGDALHLAAMAPRLTPLLDIIIVEPRADLAAGLLQHHDLRPILDRDQTRLVINPSSSEAALEYFDHVFMPKLFRYSTAILTHPAVERYAPGYAAQFVQKISAVANAASINRNTDALKAVTVVNNTCANLGTALQAPGIADFADRFAGVTGVVVSPGPSLDDDMPALRELRDRFLLIAVDTALPALLRGGVEPDLVVAIDMSEHNARNFANLSLPPATQLVFEPMVHPSIPHRFPGRRLVGRSWQPKEVEQPSGCLARWLCARTRDWGRLIGLGSTSIAAFGVAHDLGCEPIVLVGQDLAYPGNRKYAAGAVEEAAQTVDHDAVFAPNVRGELVRSSQIFILFCANLEHQIRASGKTVFNSSQHGVSISGTVSLPLAKAMAGVPPARRHITAEWSHVERPSLAGVAEVGETFRVMLDRLKAYERLEQAAAAFPPELEGLIPLMLAAGQIAYDDAMLEHRTAAALGNHADAQRALLKAEHVRAQTGRDSLARLRAAFQEAVLQIENVLHNDTQ